MTALAIVKQRCLAGVYPTPSEIESLLREAGVAPAEIRSDVAEYAASLPPVPSGEQSVLAALRSVRFD